MKVKFREGNNRPKAKQAGSCREMGAPSAWPLVSSLLTRLLSSSWIIRSPGYRRKQEFTSLGSANSFCLVASKLWGHEEMPAGFYVVTTRFANTSGFLAVNHTIFKKSYLFELFQFFLPKRTHSFIIPMRRLTRFECGQQWPLCHRESQSLPFLS